MQKVPRFPRLLGDVSVLKKEVVGNPMYASWQGFGLGLKNDPPQNPSLNLGGGVLFFYSKKIHHFIGYSLIKKSERFEVGKNECAK